MDVNSSADIESILRALLTPDSQVISAAETHLKTVLRTPNQAQQCLAALLQILGDPSKDFAIRQIAAVVISKYFMRFWSKSSAAEEDQWNEQQMSKKNQADDSTLLSSEFKQTMKHMVLQRLRDESVHALRRSILPIVAGIATLELQAQMAAHRIVTPAGTVMMSADPNGSPAKSTSFQDTWPELPPFLSAMVTNPRSASDLCIAAALIQRILELAPEVLEENADSVATLLIIVFRNASEKAFAPAVQGNNTADLPIYIEARIAAVQGLTALLLLNDEDSPSLKSAPDILTLLLQSLVHDMDSEFHLDPDAQLTTVVYDAFIDLFDFPQAFFKPYRKSVLQVAIRMATTKSAPLAAVEAAVDLLITVLSTMSKLIKKFKIVDELVDAAFTIALNEEDDALEMPSTDDVAEDANTLEISLRLLDSLVSFSATKSVMQGSLKNISHLLQPDNVNSARRCIALQTLSVIAQCEKQVSMMCNDLLMLIATQYSQADHYAIKCAAILALGRVADSLYEPLIPDEHYDNFRKVGLNMLLSAIKEPQLEVRKRACASFPVILEMFDDPSMLESYANDILTALSQSNAEGYTIEALASFLKTAGAAVKDPRMLEQIIASISAAMQNHDPAQYETRAMATYAAVDIIEVLSIHGLNEAVTSNLAALALANFNVDEPTVKEASFSFFSQLITSMGGQYVISFIEPIAPHIVKSLKQDDGVMLNKNGDEITKNLADLDDENSDVSSEDEPFQYSVRTAYLDEKVQALECIGSLAFGTTTDTFKTALYENPQPNTFLSTVASFFQNMLTLLGDLDGYFHEDLREAAVRARSRIAAAAEGPVFQILRDQNPSFVDKLIRDTMSHCLDVIDSDENIQVVATACESLALLLESLTSLDIIWSFKDPISKVVFNVMNKQTTCQQIMEEEEEEDDEPQLHAGDEAEEREMRLPETCMELVTAMSKMLRGLYQQDFLQFYQIAMQKYCTKTSTESELSMTIGAFAECLNYLHFEKCPFPLNDFSQQQIENAIPVADTVAHSLLPVALRGANNDVDGGLRRNSLFLIGVLYQRSQAQNPIWGMVREVLTMLKSVIDNENEKGATRDNAAGAIARIIFAKGCQLNDTEKRQAIKVMLIGSPLIEDESENLTLARAIILIPPNNITGITENMTSIIHPLVSAMYVTHKAKIAQEKDDFVNLDPQEVTKCVAILQAIRTRAGDHVFKLEDLGPELAAFLQSILQ